MFNKRQNIAYYLITALIAVAATNSNGWSLSGIFGTSSTLDSVSQACTKSSINLYSCRSEIESFCSKINIRECNFMKDVIDYLILRNNDCRTNRNMESCQVADQAYGQLKLQIFCLQNNQEACNELHRPLPDETSNPPFPVIKPTFPDPFIDPTFLRSREEYIRACKFECGGMWLDCLHDPCDSTYLDRSLNKQCKDNCAEAQHDCEKRCESRF